MLINVTPVAKPRMTRSDKWKKRPIVLKYRNFKDELRPYLKDITRITKTGKLALIFYLPMPESWSKKKRADMANRPCLKKVDIDNLIKAFLDAVCKEDSHIYEISAIKYWDYTGSIILDEI